VVSLAELLGHKAGRGFKGGDITATQTALRQAQDKALNSALIGGRPPPEDKASHHLLVEDRILLSGFDGFDGCVNDRPQLLGQRTSLDHIVDGIRVIRYDIEVNVALGGIRAFSAATEKDHLTGQWLQFVKKGGQFCEDEEDFVVTDEGVAGIGGVEDQLAPLLAGDESEGVKVGQGLAGSPIADRGFA